MDYTDISKIEDEALPKLTRALELVKRDKKSGRKAYLKAWVNCLTKSYRLGRDIVYKKYSDNPEIKVNKVKVNAVMIKRRAKLIYLYDFSKWRFNKLFLAFDIEYFKVQNEQQRYNALIDDWIARLPQSLATECQNMMNLGASDTGRTAELK